MGYGHDNGAPLDNKLLLNVFGKQVYQKSLPVMDCSPHTYPLAHKAPGISVKHTLWIGPIPVTFSAASQLDLDLTWGWQACDSDLSASVYIQPKATLSLSGTASLDLLVLTAGTELEASFNTALKPTAFVHGTLCNAGVEVDLVRNPADSGRLHAYYNKRKCKFLFFNCHLE